jgi:hypothetical protein
MVFNTMSNHYGTSYGHRKKISEVSISLSVSEVNMKISKKEGYSLASSSDTSVSVFPSFFGYCFFFF